MFLFACKFNRHKVANSLQGMFREELERNSLNIERKSLHVCQQFLYRIGGATCQNRKRPKLFHPHPSCIIFLRNKQASTCINCPPFSAWVRKWCRRNPPSETASERRTNLPYINDIIFPQLISCHVLVSLTSQIHFRSGSGLRDCAFVQCIALYGGK